VNLVRLKNRAWDVIDLDRDRVRFALLCARWALGIEAFGRAFELHDARDAVIVC
jgi:hypothetical protein